MSLRWPTKDPDETLDYSVDWSRFLGSDTISSVAWLVEDAAGVVTAIAGGGTVDGLTLLSSATTSTVATAKWSAGTANKNYKVTCRITFGTGSLVSGRVIRLPVKER